MTINLNFILLALLLFAAAVLATPTEMDDNSVQAKTPDGMFPQIIPNMHMHQCLMILT